MGRMNSDCWYVILIWFCCPYVWVLRKWKYCFKLDLASLCFLILATLEAEGRGTRPAKAM